MSNTNDYTQLNNKGSENGDILKMRPLSVYRREPHIESELKQFEHLSSRMITLRLQSGKSDVSNEVYVTLIRSFIIRNDKNKAWEIVKLLVDRIANRTYKHLNMWGISKADQREDTTREIIRMLIECVTSLESQQEFWECRFWVCFDRRVRTILRDLRTNRSYDISIDDEDILNNLNISQSSKGWAEMFAAKDALNMLPEPMKTAFYLKHYCGFKEESHNPAEPTIAGTLLVTGRTVRNYLKKAEEILQEWRDRD